MFLEVEQRWGGNLNRDNSKIETIDRIDRDALGRLLRHESLAIRIRNYLDPQAARELGQRIAFEKDGVQNWTVSSVRGLESSDVEVAFGTPFNVACANGRDREYYDNVSNATAKLRALSGLGSPLDRLRSDLDDVWPDGASVARDNESKMPRHSGLTRIMRGPTRWKQGFIHVDELAPLSTSSGLFSANIYLLMPEVDDSAGGNLEIWPLSWRWRYQFYLNAPTLSALTIQDRFAQFRLRERLGAPLLIHPEAGDLVLLCVQRPHAVAGFGSGLRVSLQSFFAHQGPGRPLLLEN